jgi:hypothetical protein
MVIHLQETREFPFKVWPFGVEVRKHFGITTLDVREIVYFFRSVPRLLGPA